MGEPVIGLTLSGGGSRAIAFHLGCLRALSEFGILDQVQVLSTVSGGSVIGGIYASNEESFEIFEEKIRSQLSRGFVKPALWKAITTMEGPKTLCSFILTGSVSLFITSISLIAKMLSAVLPTRMRLDRWINRIHLPFTRFASRTTILRKVFDEDVFKGIKLRELPKKRPLLIVNAADLRTGSAFYFSRQSSGSWRMGKAASTEISLAHAVTASAAYPLILPALDERMAFDKHDGSRREERVTLTDGGVYDNLGLSALWPDRDPSISLNVVKVDTIICCRAGYGLRLDPPSQFFIARLKSVFACALDRAQNGALSRLHDLKASGKLNGFIVPFLGQDDSRLAHPPADLVTRENAYNYPTNFSPMPDDWIDLLSKRGEQLTRALIVEHMPHLIDQNCDEA